MPTLTQGQWSALVAEWNARQPSARQALATECKASGHRWAWVPSQGAQVCRRCAALRFGPRS